MIKYGCFIWSKKKLKNSRYTVVVFHIYFKILSYVPHCTACFFWIFFLQKGLKMNHEMAGITNCEITKCRDPMYYDLSQTFLKSNTRPVCCSQLYSKAYNFAHKLTLVCIRLECMKVCQKARVPEIQIFD